MTQDAAARVLTNNVVQLSRGADLRLKTLEALNLGVIDFASAEMIDAETSTASGTRLALMRSELERRLLVKLMSWAESSSRSLQIRPNHVSSVLHSARKDAENLDVSRT